MGLMGGSGLLLAGVGCATTPGTPTAVVASAPTAAAGAGLPTAAVPIATPSPAPPPQKRGGTLHSSTSNSWPDLDPHQTSNSSVFGLGIGVYSSRLLKFRLQGVQLPAFIPTGDAAESWEQPDDVTYIFKLRANAKWQNIPPVNGRPLVAEDIVYSFGRQRTAGFPNASILDGLAKIEAVDRATVKLTTSAPAADFLINVAAPYSLIVAKEAVDLKGDLKEGPLVGTGPFIVESTDPRGTSVARRNPDYFIPGQPFIDGYEYIVIPDAQTRSSAFRAGTIDFLLHGSVSVDEAATLKRANPAFNVLMVKGLGSGTDFGLKLDRPPFNDLRVRRAVYKAIDPRTIIDTAYGSGWMSVGFAMPSVEWALPQDEIAGLYKRDLPGARQLLKEAGMENGFDFTFSVHNINPSYVSAGELIVAQLKEANIRATTKPVDAATYSGQVQGRGDFEAFLGSSNGAPSADAALSGQYHSKGSRNITKVNDPKLDQMIERQSTLGRNPDERKKALLEIQRYILDQAYLHQIQSFESPTVVQPYLRDYFPGFGSLQTEPDKWSIVWLDK
jgi:peptide/nickel transport system substrate-binding protein